VGEWVCVCVKTKMLEVISDIAARWRKRQSTTMEAPVGWHHRLQGAV